MATAFPAWEMSASRMEFSSGAPEASQAQPGMEREEEEQAARREPSITAVGAAAVGEAQRRFTEAPAMPQK